MASIKLTFLFLAFVILAVVLVEYSQADRRSRNQARGNRGSNPVGRAARGNRGNSTGRGAGRRAGRRRPRVPPPGCEEIHLPMCKGLVPYTHTKLPNSFNHTTQLEVYRELEHQWTYMDHSCSKNLRLMLCSKYLPKCVRRGAPHGPCKKTCMRAKTKCATPLKEDFRVEWARTFPCRGLPSRKCVKPMREQRCPRPYPNPRCVSNEPLEICANLSFTWGTLPNMYQQCHISDINTELNNFRSLLASNCHQNLNFLVCGSYMPFCISQDRQPFTFPCRELCEEVRTSCESHYSRLNQGLPWPAKLQCHRLPLSTDSRYNCVMPDEGNLFRAGGGRSTAATP